jgi:hypothetical protein
VVNELYNCQDNARTRKNDDFFVRLLVHDDMLSNTSKLHKTMLFQINVMVTPNFKVYSWFLYFPHLMEK